MTYEESTPQAMRKTCKGDARTCAGQPDAGCGGSQVDPAHYRLHGTECIEVIRAALTPEEFRGFLKGNVIKYNFRAGHKGRASIDYGKAGWYQNALREVALDWEWRHPDEAEATEEQHGGNELKEELK